MTISLIITTYNRLDALELVLLSVLAQRVMPDEVIIADDGSAKETQELIQKYQSIFTVPLIHSWQEDKGFRAARSRNLAISKSSSAYIIVLDGDMVLHPMFINDHKIYAQRGFFVNGSRALLSEKSTQKHLQERKHVIRWWNFGVMAKENAIRMPWLHKIIKGQLTGPEGVRSANMGFWKSDLIEVGGFDEAFVGWGREDSELAVRLMNAKVNRKNLKFAAIGFHLYHREEPRDHFSENDALLKESIQKKIIIARKSLLKTN